MAGACRCVAIPWGCCGHARYPVLLARRAARAFQKALKRHERRCHQGLFAPIAALSNRSLEPPVGFAARASRPIR